MKEKVYNSLNKQLFLQNLRQVIMHSFQSAQTLSVTRNSLGCVFSFSKVLFARKLSFSLQGILNRGSMDTPFSKYLICEPEILSKYLNIVDKYIFHQLSHSETLIYLMISIFLQEIIPPRCAMKILQSRSLIPLQQYQPFY